MAAAKEERLGTVLTTVGNGLDCESCCRGGGRSYTGESKAIEAACACVCACVCVRDCMCLGTCENRGTAVKGANLKTCEQNQDISNISLQANKLYSS